MIHYNLWFSFHDHVKETEGLSAVQAFLSELQATGQIAEFQLLKNSGSVGKTKMLPFQVLMEFRDDTQFSAAFSAQAALGIHTGLHGHVMSMVAQFQIEIFRQIADLKPSSAAEPCYEYACEV